MIHHLVDFMLAKHMTPNVLQFGVAEGVCVWEGGLNEMDRSSGFCPKRIEGREGAS